MEMQRDAYILSLSLKVRHFIRPYLHSGLHRLPRKSWFDNSSSFYRRHISVSLILISDRLTKFRCWSYSKHGVSHLRDKNRISLDQWETRIRHGERLSMTWPKHKSAISSAHVTTLLSRDKKACLGWFSIRMCITSSQRHPTSFAFQSFYVLPQVRVRCILTKAQKS